MSRVQNSFRQGTPLTLDQIRSIAPSVFATKPYIGVSDKYTFIPTIDVVQHLMKQGFQPFAVSQSRTRLADKQAFTKHMLRFRMAAASKPVVGDVFLESTLVNGHDRSSAFKFFAGLFRWTCTNGMFVPDSLVHSINIRHQGNILEEVTHGAMEIVDHMPEVIDAVERWRQIQLRPDQQAAFAEAAHVLRFADSEGKVHTPITPDQLLHTRRPEDNHNDLWTVFNRVQENVTRGGLSARKSTGRKITTREVKGIDQDIRLNRALWTLGERMAELVTAPEVERAPEIEPDLAG